MSYSHTDALGRPLSIGDRVAYVDYRRELSLDCRHLGGLPISKMTNTYVYLEYAPGKAFKISPSKVFYLLDQIKANHINFPEYFI